MDHLARLRQHRAARDAHPARHHLIRAGAALAVLIVALSHAACSPAREASPATPAATAAPSPARTETPTAMPAETPVLVAVTLYLPDETGRGLVAVPAQAEDSPEGILAALVSAGALPDVDYANLSYSVAEEELVYEDGTFSGVLISLDLPDAFAQAFRYAPIENQRLMLHSLVNTFLAYGQADGLLLSIEGTDLETMLGRFDEPISFDELATTLNTTPP